jgi:excisionase family DNA binding protein
MLSMLTVSEAANRTGRSPETVRRWIRQGRLPAERVGTRHAIRDEDLARIVDELYPMAELPADWRLGEDGSPAPNWVAGLYLSRIGR